MTISSNNGKRETNATTKSKGTMRRVIDINQFIKIMLIIKPVTMI